MPRRIQLKRTKGWRLPPGAVVVSRPSKWGNPYAIGDPGIPDAETAVMAYDIWLRIHPTMFDDARRELKGKDLACWCSVDVDQPCHADVLLEVANQ